MGGRAGGGASGGMGKGSRSGAPKHNFITLQGGKVGTVRINAKKSPQQVLKQANKLAKGLAQQIGGKSFSSLTEVGLFGQTKLTTGNKIQAAQKASQIAKKIGKS